MKADHYRYTYTEIGSKQAMQGHWWNRRYLRPYLQVVNVESLTPFLKQFGWYDITETNVKPPKRKKRI